MSIALNNVRTLEDIRDLVLTKTAFNRDYITTVPDLIEGMVDPMTVHANGEGELVLTPYGFAQLVRDRLGLPPAIFKRADLTNSLKLEIMRQAAQSVSDKTIKVRAAGNQIHSFVSEQYAFFDNSMLAMALWQLRESGVLPANTGVMSFYLSNAGRDMNLRLRFPDWDFTIMEGDRKATFLTNLVISNNELASGAFKINVAITRHLCLNSTIGDTIWKVEHMLHSYDDFFGALRQAAELVNGYGEQMAEQMRQLQTIEVSAPMLIFEKIGEELGVPKYAMQETVRYYENSGSGGTLYDVVQALSAGARPISVPEGRRQANWEKRSVIEQNLWSTAVALRNMHAEGQSIDEWVLTGEAGVREMCARYIEGFRGMVEEADMLAEGIRTLVVV